MKKMNTSLKPSRENQTKPLDSFHFFDELLPELISHVLVSVFLQKSLKAEFPKLFCVCHKWIEFLDNPSIHKVIENEMNVNDKWYQNRVVNNLRLFDKEIFPKVVFLNNVVSNFKPVGLLHSGSIINEKGRIDTENGVYCVTENGCCRFKNQCNEIYLEPFDLFESGPLYTPKGKDSVPLYIPRHIPRNASRFREFFANVVHPGTLMEALPIEEYGETLPSEQYLLLNRKYWGTEDDLGIDVWIKKEDFKIQKVYSFMIPSIKKRCSFLIIDEKREEKDNEMELIDDIECEIIPKHVNFDTVEDISEISTEDENSDDSLEEDISDDSTDDDEIRDLTDDDEIVDYSTAENEEIM